MRCKSLLAGFGLAVILPCVLGGCLPPSKDWTHPRIADPRKEDKQFLKDTEFCKDKVGPAGTEVEQKTAMDECYRRLGWQHKD